MSHMGNNFLISVAHQIAMRINELMYVKALGKPESIYKCGGVLLSNDALRTVEMEPPGLELR